jgi:hypothetical protein
MPKEEQVKPLTDIVPMTGESRGGQANPMVGVRYRRPADRRTKPQRWTDAVETLLDVLDRYRAWRNNLPAELADSALAEQLDAVLELRERVKQLEAAVLPKDLGQA